MSNTKLLRCADPAIGNDLLIWILFNTESNGFSDLTLYTTLLITLILLLRSVLQDLIFIFCKLCQTLIARIFVLISFEY